eukprot:TRINITY_DN19848_c1_g1_i1.p1 TRINITY_DN19848_c1_g1~~TRINITY_DN19848_c1_g1_i1.p1  ORF type:complete len:316 (+),score=68.68 TRINITY_DN19848_c1_g1_i1:570-1517(+)
MVSAAEMEEVESLERELAPMAGKPGGDFNTKIQYLQLVRKYKLRRSELVSRHGMELLNSSRDRSKLGKDVWSVYEQVAVAALDCHNLEASKMCIGALMKRFPGSLRIGKLEGMWLEAKGWWDQAERHYTNLLEEAPAEAGLHKRKVAMLRAQGRTAAAVAALIEYLDIFAADSEAWRELAEMYSSLQMYKQAAFCWEEVILSNPVNPVYNLQYAQILYTMGGAENIKLARQYYAAAVQYSGGHNLRALYGLCLCAAAAAPTGKTSRGGGGSKEDGSLESVLPKLAAQTIESEYRKHCPEKLTLVTASLGKLGLAT